MNKTIRVAIFGSGMECCSAKRLLGGIAEGDALELRIHLLHEVDELRHCMVTQSPDLVISLADGTAGMEAIYLVRKYDAALPVLWFSDDPGFAMQSHRLECSYFSVKPLTAEKMRRALYSVCPAGRRAGAKRGGAPLYSTV